MNSDEVNRLTLLLTAANVFVNVEILDVSKQLLIVSEQHLRLFREYKEMMEKSSNAGNL